MSDVPGMDELEILAAGSVAAAILHGGGAKKAGASYDRLEALLRNRVELIEALEAFVSNSSVQTNSPAECEQAEAAIAKAKELEADNG